jgi:hypothetical protein
MSNQNKKANVQLSNDIKEHKQILHPKLPQYSAEDVLMRVLVKKRSRFVLKLSRELVLLKDGSFVYFTCDKQPALKLFVPKGAVSQIKITRDSRLEISVVKPVKRTMLFFFEESSVVNSWAEALSATQN